MPRKNLPKSDRPREFFTLRLSEQLREAIRDRARLEGISQNALINKAVIEELFGEEKPNLYP